VSVFNIIAMAVFPSLQGMNMHTDSSKKMGFFRYHLFRPGPIDPAITIFNQSQLFFKSEKGSGAGALLFYIS
jgi:hypothetical protein